MFARIRLYVTPCTTELSRTDPTFPSRPSVHCSIFGSFFSHCILLRGSSRPPYYRSEDKWRKGEGDNCRPVEWKGGSEARHHHRPECQGYTWSYAHKDTNDRSSSRKTLLLLRQVVGRWDWIDRLVSSRTEPTTNDRDQWEWGRPWLNSIQRRRLNVVIFRWWWIAIIICLLIGILYYKTQ